MIAPKSYGDNYKKIFDRMYLSLSKKYNLNYIPFILEGVALNPDLNLMMACIQTKKELLSLVKQY